MTHSSSVHQKCGGQYKTRKTKVTAGKGFWKPERTILIKETGTRRMGWHSVVIVTCKHAESETAQEFYCLRVEEWLRHRAKLIHAPKFDPAARM